MSNTTGTETCGCGASLTVSSYGSAAVDQMLATFRRNHRHELPEPEVVPIQCGVAGEAPRPDLGNAAPMVGL